METENKWCTYGSWGKNSPSSIGKLLEQHGNSGTILYSEGQLYPPELWDMAYVEVFDTVEEAIIFFIEHNYHQYSLHKIKEYWDFPSINIDWDKLNEIEDEININK